MRLADLNTVNRRQINRAGARYTPGLDPGAPNIEVRELMLALAALGAQEESRAHVRELESAVREGARWTSKTVEQAFRGRKSTPEEVAGALIKLATSRLEEFPEKAGRLERTVRRVQATLIRAQNTLYERERKAESDKSRRALREKLDDIRRMLSPVSEVAAFVDSPPFALLSQNAMLLLGAWGTGKTHSLCDLTRHRMEGRLPTLLYLAHSLPYGRDPLEGLCDETGLAATPTELLEGLERLGKAKGCRALLLIDGINEGDRVRWAKSITAITRAIRPLKHVGLVLSCRQPFDDLIFTPRTKGKFIVVEHRGFEDIEVDAQVEFFTFYGIPAPHAPLLTPEFSRPLFLKMLCESVRNRSTRSKSQYVRDLNSGQKGMTLVLEDFTKALGKPIEKDFGLPRLTCWRLLKGDRMIPKGPVVGIAPTMALLIRDYVSREKCLSLISLFTGWASRDRCEEFLHRLLADGLLVESVRWENSVPVPVIQFPYQRFGDHLIARNLLDRQLRLDSESAIRRSFYRNRPLGQIFELTRGRMSFKMPGLASAIMLEFPERVKRVLPPDERELVTYLPRDRRLAGPLRDVFLDGLYWRPADSFSRRTDHVINFYLQQGHEWTRNAVLEVLVGLATRPGHPYSASRLRDFLAEQEMADRDLFWSEFLRRCGGASAALRLLEWIERTEGQPRTREIVESCVALLSLFLTTTRRRLRDRATRALYHLGLSEPRVLFASTVASLKFSDPYVPERMLAASYGVSMSMWADPSGSLVHSELPNLARTLAKAMFLPRGRHRTTHVLMQDYALGIIELARRVAPRTIPRSQLRFLRRPLRSIRSRFLPVSRISEQEADKVKSVLHTDFENYTLGRLVPDRGNYDYEHRGYSGVRRQILWRVGDLGYSEDRLSSVDRAIMYESRDNDPARTERYGKKYSWIAFFEMYGVRRVRGELARWREDRPSDADIDPSFPQAPRSWMPPRSGLLESGPSESREWLQCGLRPKYGRLLRRKEVASIDGPWILLEAFIEESAKAEHAKADRRRLFTFASARLVEQRTSNGLLARFHRLDYPGNHVIPEYGNDFYTYAGEIPWSTQFASGLRLPDGSGAPHIEDAFPVYESGSRKGFPVEVPVFRWSWESYHSAMNQVTGIFVPAPALCEALELVNRCGEWDLFDQQGRRATVFAQLESKDEGLDCHFLFLREDLLRTYLAKVKRELVWFVWGERDVRPEDMILGNRDQWSDIFQRYENIHRRAYTWKPDTSSLVEYRPHRGKIPSRS